MSLAGTISTLLVLVAVTPNGDTYGVETWADPAPADEVFCSQEAFRRESWPYPFPAGTDFTCLIVEQSE